MSQDRPPTPPYGRTVTLKQGYELHYLEEGRGAPIVFVHGSGPGVNAYSNFFPNYRVIAAAGFRSVLPDMVGFGWSSKPTDIDYTLDLFVPTLREFLDQLDRNPSFLRSAGARRNHDPFRFSPGNLLYGDFVVAVDLQRAAQFAQILR